MARHLRLEYDGAIYHVTSRGNERSDVFACDGDKERFLDKLAENVRQHHVRLYAYVVMTNHFHLLLETPRGNLSGFMQQLNTSYTMYYNAKHERVGHVFSGRYKAKVVSGDEYLLALTRYIHLNPVKVAAVARLDIGAKIEMLNKYLWSSYGGYAGLRKPEEWMDYGPLSELTRKYGSKGAEGYRVFVEGGLAEDDADLKEALGRSSKAVGGRKFCREVERDYRATMRKMVSGVDVAMRRTETGADASAVVGLVCREFGTSPESLRRRRNTEDARLLAAKLLKEHAGLTQREVGQILGLADGSGLGNMLKLAERRLVDSRKLSRILGRLERKM